MKKKNLTSSWSCVKYFTCKIAYISLLKGDDTKFIGLWYFLLEFVVLKSILKMKQQGWIEFFCLKVCWFKEWICFFKWAKPSWYKKQTFERSVWCVTYYCYRKRPIYLLKCIVFFLFFHQSEVSGSWESLNLVGEKNQGTHMNLWPF